MLSTFIQKWLFNDRTSLRNQLFVSFLLVTVITGAVTLAICLGMLYGLADSTYHNADSIIIENTKLNAEGISRALASSVNQKLQLVGQSVCQVNSLFGTLLLNESEFNGTAGDLIITPRRSFKEYDFVSGCSFPRCPQDFGPIAGRSRLPVIHGFENGSLEASSVYVYSVSDGHSLADDSLWSNAIQNEPALRSVINGLSLLDLDYHDLYFNASQSLVMLYTSASISYASSSPTHYVHRTYPGIRKNDSYYNPGARSWFKNSQVDVLYLYGPYIETFTQQVVLTLSSRQQTTLSHTGKVVDVVSAAVFLVDDLVEIVQSVSLPNGGYSALIRNSGTNAQVLVWGNRTDIYDFDQNRFRTIADFDSHLAAIDWSVGSSFTYADGNGTVWIVRAESLFSIKSPAVDALVVLVFFRQTEAQQPLSALRQRIHHTTSSATLSTVLIVGVSCVAVLIIVWVLVLWLVKPLQTMRHISAQLVHKLAEDDDSRDFQDEVRLAYANITRNDEVGALASEYYNVVAILQDKTVKRRNTLKWPSNPFELSESEKAHCDPTKLSVEQWSSLVASRAEPSTAKSSSIDSLHSSSLAGTQQHDDLNVLAGLEEQLRTAERKKNHNTKLNKFSTSPVNPYVVVASSDVDIEMAKRSSQSLPTTAPTVSKISPISFSTRLKSIKQLYWCVSLKSRLFVLSLVLFCSALVTMLVTLRTLLQEGDHWTNGSASDLEAAQMMQLSALGAAKQTFVETYYTQQALDLSMISKYSEQLLNEELQDADWQFKKKYLSSYSIDSASPFVMPDASSSDYSAYFVSTDANCAYADCEHTNNGTRTKRTSLLDLKYRSYLYKGNSLSFSQIALESGGFTRYLPAIRSSTNANPTSCLISTQETPLCANLYDQSKCNPAHAQDDSYVYPAYEARCRQWYALALEHRTSSDIYFQRPRLSSSGQYVVSSISAVHYSNGSLLGAVSNNLLASTFSNSINALTVLQSGYAFIVDRTNASQLIVHPSATVACGEIYCAEGFRNNEISEFRDNIVDPLTNGVALSALPTSYAKRGKTWRVSYSAIDLPTANYVLMLTVPQDEVLRVSVQTQDSIRSTAYDMTVGFAILLAFFLASLVYFAHRLSDATVRPIEDLRTVFALAYSHESHSDGVDKQPGHPMAAVQSAIKCATSSDMKMLLEACARLLVALRFGSQSFGKGDLRTAKTIFTDALELFEAIGNAQGMGSAINNLAAVELAQGNYEISCQLYRKSIANAKALIQKAQEQLDSTGTLPASPETSAQPLPSSDEENQQQSETEVKHEKASQALRSMQNLCSDREGNLAAALLAHDRSSEAFALIERLLSEDKHRLYIKGCIHKQLLLSQYYVQQDELTSAQRVLESAIQFVRTRSHLLVGDTSFAEKSRELASAEICALEQLVLCNFAQLREKQNATDHAEQLYVECLVNRTNISLSTTRTVLQHLRHLKQEQSALDCVTFLECSAVENDIDLAIQHSANQQRSRQRKRVVFAVDYSGSMSGTKIRSAVSNVSNIFDNFIVEGRDSIALIIFNGGVSREVNLTLRTEDNSKSLKASIDRLISPCGSTKLYDALLDALSCLTSTPDSTSCDWIVALTDGEDNGSTLSLDGIREKLAANRSINLALLGVGRDVQTSLLQSIADSNTSPTKKGIYLAAEANKESIDLAFGQVAQLINQAQVILED